MTKRLCIYLLVGCVSFAIYSEEIVLLRDGRPILVRDNFTWGYADRNTEKMEPRSEV